MVEGAEAESTTTLERLLCGPPGSPCRVVVLPRGAADDAVEAVREVQVGAALPRVCGGRWTVLFASDSK